MTVNIEYAQKHLSELIARAKSGEEVVIVEAGKPQVNLLAVKEPTRHKKRTPGRFAGHQIGDDFFEPMPKSELDHWESSKLIHTSE